MTPAGRERLAKNEALFREVNERIRDVNRGLDAEGASEFLCECSDPACLATVPLSLAEYEAVRSVPTHFLVASGHARAGLEVVVERRQRYDVVEKQGRAAAAAAERADPRR